MTNLQLKIIKNAIKIRLKNGEDIDEILNSYPKLSKEEADEIRAELA